MHREVNKQSIQHIGKEKRNMNKTMLGDRYVHRG